jgi:hypothetical protein
MDRRLGFGALCVAIVALSACNTGGGVVTANNPLNPTPAPSAGVTATPTAGPPTPTPSPTPVGPTPTPSPTPSPTPTAAVCGAPPPDPNTATITLTGAQQTVIVPCFGDFTSTAIVPAGNGAGVTVALAASTDKNLGGVADSKYGTPIVYTSLQPSTSITFNGTAPSITTTITSASKVSAPHTYAVQVYVPNFGAAIQTVTGLKPSGHTITFPIVPPGGAFPAIEAVVIVYQSS